MPGLVTVLLAGGRSVELSLCRGPRVFTKPCP